MGYAIYLLYLQLPIQLTKVVCNQATIGEIKEEVAEVIVHVHGKNKRRKLATLKPRTGPQQLLDWMLEEDFTITYTLTNGSVCLLGGITRKSYKDYPYPKHATVLLT